MSLVLLTGAVRSGKSRIAEDLALSRGGGVVVAVAGWGGDEEMERRIEAHRASRPASWVTVQVGADPEWLAQVPKGSVLLLDCLGTLISNICVEEVGEAAVACGGAEARVAVRVDALLSALLERRGDTIVVTNEVGWGVVPAWASARLFRDELGRANRRMSDEADSSCLIVDGRCIDLSALPTAPKWPTAGSKEATDYQQRTNVTGQEFLDTMIAAIPEPDPSWESRAWGRLDSLTKPPRSLGLLEEVAQRIAVLQRTERPALPRKAIVLMAGDHGVTAQGISPYPSEVTVQMVANIATGGAAINQLAAHADARVVVVDVGVANPLLHTNGVVQARVADGTADMTQGPAMTRDQALAAIRVGIEQVAQLATGGLELVGTGEMGIGNSTAAAAITSVLADVDPVDVVGPGTGLDAAGVAHKADVIRRAIEINVPDPEDPLDVLAKVGGLEIAGLVGVVIGAASLGIPVVSDGYISGAATLVALRLAPAARPWVFASHRSAEPGHQIVLEALGLRPVLSLDMRLGEGTGAALAMELMDAACAVMSGMATFEQAGVANRDE